MTESKESLHWDQLRGDIADVQRPQAESTDTLRKARAMFLLSSTTRPPASRRDHRRAFFYALAAAAALVLGVASWAKYRASTTALTFDTGAARASGQIGELLSARPSETLPLHFSDGTLLSLASSSQARVTTVTPLGATIVLEDGSLSAAVVHREATNWRVAAGPFTVLITGTKFDVRWNAADKSLALDLLDGSVTVLGPTLGASGKRVAPGEKLRVSGVPKADGEQPGATAPSSEGIEPAPSPHDTAASPAARSSWRQLASSEHYTEAMAAAEEEGFDTICRHASAADVLLLANTARFSGASARAQQAFRAVRSRFAGQHEAAMAAFALGRIAYDERKDFSASAKWFEKYLREEPSGGLAREAAGRLIEAYQSAGDMIAARAAAQRYLTQYPAGPHAALARGLVGSR
jgi:ferric-dicitrate binding protein FerR (iron transport regulator)